MRKIILSIVAIVLVAGLVFVGIKSDGFTNLGNVFDIVQEKVDKLIKPTSSTAAISDTTDSSTKFLLYNEQRELTRENYIPYLHKYSEDYNDIESDTMYYMHINANLTSNSQFTSFMVSFGNENTDSINLTISNEFGDITAEYTYSNYEEVMNGVEFPTYKQNLEFLTGKYDFYIVFEKTKNSEKLIICYYSSDQGAADDRLTQALKFPIFVFEKNNEAYDFAYNLFDNRAYAIFYSANILDDNENIVNELITTEYYKSLTNINLEPREGYTFKGFFYDEEFTKPYTGMPPKPFEELYQKWEINTYKVTYDCRTVDDFNLDLIERTYTYGEYIDYTPVREGYDFICWINDENNQEYNAAEKITSNLYLRAQWGIHKIKITYVDSDESFLYEQFIEKGEYANYVPKKIGFKFIGWCNYEPGWPINEDITLKACWITAECTITLFINNNVYKAYKVGYGQSLSVFLNDIGIKQKYIAKYAYADLTGSNIPIEEINVEQDMRIDISDSLVKNQDIVASINENKSLIVLCSGAGGAVVLILVLGAIFGGKKKKSKR